VVKYILTMIRTDRKGPGERNGKIPDIGDEI
jgi:hypothetical protein